MLAQEIDGIAPGSTDPERVAIGTPSSGLKPIVVSTERPSRTAVTEQPPPRWQATSREAAHLRGDPLDRDAVEAVPADAPVLPPPARHGVRRRLLGDRGVEGRVEDGDVGEVGKRLPRLADRSEGGRVVQRREWRTAASICGDDPVVDQRRLAKRSPPWTTRCPTAVGSARSRPRRSTSSPSTRCRFRLVEPALTTRTVLTGF